MRLKRQVVLMLWINNGTDSLCLLDNPNGFEQI